MIKMKTNKQKRKNKQLQKQTMQGSNEYMYTFNSRGWDTFKKFVAVSEKNFEDSECFSKILFNIDVMDLYLLPCSCIYLKRLLKF